MTLQTLVGIVEYASDDDAKEPTMTAPAPTGKVWRSCVKCKSTGRVTMYAHVAGGTCFDCGGEGRYLAPADWREREARAEARRKREAARRAASGANARLWARFAAAHPAEAALIEQHKDDDLAYAYGGVATYEERDSNPAQALRMAREYARERGITLVAAQQAPTCPNCGNGMFHNGLPGEPYWCGACGMRVARDQIEAPAQEATTSAEYVDPRRALLAVACPRCKAQPGGWCKSGSGYNTGCHAQRYKAAGINRRPY